MADLPVNDSRISARVARTFLPATVPIITNFSRLASFFPNQTSSPCLLGPDLSFSATLISKLTTGAKRIKISDIQEEFLSGMKKVEIDAGSWRILKLLVLRKSKKCELNYMKWL